jgi:thiosulfate dehydrogenase [quinone] large subunit
MLSNKTRSYTFLFLLRIGLGWLFLHEGLTKLLQSDWSSYYYMQNATGPLRTFLTWISADEGLLQFTDYTIIFLLVGIGISLILGLFERIGSVLGMLLLGMFYLAYPPFGDKFLPVAEGNYFIVDKNLILFFGLLVVWQFRSGLVLGLDSFFKRKKRIE